MIELKDLQKNHLQNINFLLEKKFNSFLSKKKNLNFFRYTNMARKVSDRLNRQKAISYWYKHNELFDKKRFGRRKSTENKLSANLLWPYYTKHGLLLESGYSRPVGRKNLWAIIFVINLLEIFFIEYNWRKLNVLIVMLLLWI